LEKKKEVTLGGPAKAATPAVTVRKEKRENKNDAPREK